MFLEEPLTFRTPTKKVVEHLKQIACNFFRRQEENVYKMARKNIVNVRKVDTFALYRLTKIKIFLVQYTI